MDIPNTGFVSGLFRIFSVGAIIVASTSSLVATSFASAELQLATIKSDNSSDISRFTLLVDDDSKPISFRYYTSADSYDEVSVDKLPTAPTLLTRSGHDILKLKSESFNTEVGGPLDLVYVHNGFTDNYKTFHMQLLKGQDGWFLGVVKDGLMMRFDSLYMTMFRYMGQVVGIDKIIPSNSSVKSVASHKGISKSKWTLEQGQQELEVLRVTSDALSGESSMRIVVDGKFDIVALRLYVKNEARTEFTIDKLPSGFVLFRSQGYDVVKLKGRGFDPRSGGHLELIYLVNALAGKTGTFEMDLAQKGSSWALGRKENGTFHEFTEMFLKGNKAFGQYVGIKSVEVK